MLVISNNIVSDLVGLKSDYIVRLNMAWFDDAYSLNSELERLRDKPVFLDYPDGRSKPPQPRLKINDALEALARHRNIRYFAISNAESIAKMLDLRALIPSDVVIVPKIETVTGVQLMRELMEALETTVAMLDKEDIYTNVKADSDEYNYHINKARATAKKNGYILIELEGVVFREHR